jgi:hypothetical protein
MFSAAFITDALSVTVGLQGVLRALPRSNLP